MCIDWPIEELDGFGEFAGVGNLDLDSGFSYNAFSYFYDDFEHPMSGIAFQGPGIAGYGYSDHASSRFASSSSYDRIFKFSSLSDESTGMRENSAAQLLLNCRTCKKWSAFVLRSRSSTALQLALARYSAYGYVSVTALSHSNTDATVHAKPPRFERRLMKMLDQLQKLCALTHGIVYFDLVTVTVQRSSTQLQEAEANIGAVIVSRCDVSQAYAVDTISNTLVAAAAAACAAVPLSMLLWATFWFSRAAKKGGGDF
eukprot:19541-Heterococcus_DN1.PRE.1